MMPQVKSQNSPNFFYLALLLPPLPRLLLHPRAAEDEDAAGGKDGADVGEALERRE